MFPLQNYLQQAVAAPAEIPATLQAGIAVLLLALAREAPKAVGAGIAWVSAKTEERRKNMQIIDKLLTRITALEERADTAALEAKTASAQSKDALELAQKASTELREVKVQLDATLEDNKTMSTLIEALKTEKKLVETEREYWKGEYTRVNTELEREREEKSVLIMQLKKHDTDKLDPAKVPATDPAQPAAAPPAEGNTP